MGISSWYFPTIFIGRMCFNSIYSYGCIQKFVLYKKVKKKISFQNCLGSSGSTSMVTSVSLPSECSSYTSNSDSTRHFTYTANTTLCDNTSPFGASSVWIRFTGGAGTMLANGAVPMNRCGTTTTGYYNGTLPAVGSTVQGTVCFTSGTNNCSNPTIISVANCNGFYIYYLSAVSSCAARYCTVWFLLCFSMLTFHTDRARRQVIVSFFVFCKLFCEGSQLPIPQLYNKRNT